MIGDALIVGAGPVGSMLAIGLGRRGVRVRVVERRSRLACGSAEVDGSRSVGLSLCGRGVRALSSVDAADAVRERAVMMNRRVLHMPDGTIDDRSYGAPDRINLAISRGDLTETLIARAEATRGVTMQFDTRCVLVDPQAGRVCVEHAGQTSSSVVDLVAGADGARSIVRSSFLEHPGFDFSQTFFPSGYVEVPLLGAGLSLEAIHIWRSQRPLVGLPTLEGDVRGSFVLPFDGPDSFAQAEDAQGLLDVIDRVHPGLAVDRDALRKTYHPRRIGRMVTIRCSPYHRGRAFLVGDAAHAMCPFMGQGVNAGLEDVEVFLRLVDEQKRLEDALAEYSALRVPEGQAAAELSLWNYTELGGEPAVPEAPPPVPDVPPIVLVNFFPVSYRAILEATRRVSPRSVKS